MTPQQYVDDHPSDRARKIRVTLMERFEAELVLHERIPIDEVMIPLKGRWGGKQYIRSKLVKWGIRCVGGPGNQVPVALQVVHRPGNCAAGVQGPRRHGLCCETTPVRAGWKGAQVDGGPWLYFTHTLPPSSTDGSWGKRDVPDKPEGVSSQPHQEEIGAGPLDMAEGC